MFGMKFHALRIALAGAIAPKSSILIDFQILHCKPDQRDVLRFVGTVNDTTRALIDHASFCQRGGPATDHGKSMTAFQFADAARLYAEDLNGTEANKRARLNALAEEAVRVVHDRIEPGQDYINEWGQMAQLTSADRRITTLNDEPNALALNEMLTEHNQPLSELRESFGYPPKKGMH